MARRTTSAWGAAVIAALLVGMLGVLPVHAAATWLLPSTVIDSNTAVFPESAVTPGGEAVLVYVATVAGKQVVHATSHAPGGTWSPPVPISDPSVDATEPHVVIDGAGNATAVWREFSTSTPIQSAFRPAGGAWGAPTYVSVPTANAIGPALAVDAAGTVTVVWTHVEGMGTEYVESASRALAGVWSAPETRSTGFALNPTVAAGPAGVAVAAWVVSDSGQSHVVGTVKGASGWAEPVALSAPSSFTGQPRSALDGTGRALVAWSRYENPYEIIQLAERAPGGAWSPAGDLSVGGADARGVQLDVNANGYAVVGWYRYDGTYYRAQVTTRPPGGAWVAPASLSAEGRDAVLVDVGIDPAADVVAVWTRNNGTVPVVQASRRPAGGAWSPVDDLSPGAVESSAGGIAVDGAGDVVTPLDIFTTPSRVEVTALDVAGPVVLGLSAPATGTTGKVQTFAATATDTWSAVSSFAWSFGDGTTATGASVSHTYAVPGTYTASLTVTDAVGNATTRTAGITVAAPTPVIGTFKLTETKIQALARAVATRTKLKVRLNTKATLKLVFKSKHKHLVNGKKKYVKVTVKKKLPAGLSKITIKAKVGGKILKPDTYVIKGTAKNSTGSSAKKKVTLKVVA